MCNSTNLLLLRGWRSQSMTIHFDCANEFPNCLNVAWIFSSVMFVLWLHNPMEELNDDCWYVVRVVHSLCLNWCVWCRVTHPKMLINCCLLLVVDSLIDLVLCCLDVVALMPCQLIVKKFDATGLFSENFVFDECAGLSWMLRLNCCEKFCMSLYYHWVDCMWSIETINTSRCLQLYTRTLMLYCVIGRIWMAVYGTMDDSSDSPCGCQCN